MFGNSVELYIVGFILVMGIFLYGWIDYRRTIRVGNFGLAMVKSRLNDARQAPRRRSRES
ncbi:hypothetical protein [Candidatus Nitrospira salsa]|nr:MAG: hypothetical protein NPIRA01_17680 [Nitrospirales bacterium]